MARFEVEITNTWRVEVEADNKKDAETKALAMKDEGYTEASDYDGAEVNYSHKL